MNGKSVLQFYGTARAKEGSVCENPTVRFVADIVSKQIFQSLRFPVREKASKTLRVHIDTKDRAHFKRMSGVDQLLKRGTVYNPNWRERIVSGEGDINVITDSVMKVRKIRAENYFVKSRSGGYVNLQKHHGWELAIKITRARRVGDRH